MFLDILEFRVQKKNWENCFENLVSEIYQKGKFGPQNPQKTVNVFIVFFFFSFFLVFALFSKSSFVDILTIFC